MAAMVGIGRMNFAYPDFAKDVVAGKIDAGNVCITCGMCSMIMRNGSTPGCVVRDAEVYMPLYKEHVHDRNIIV
jgi:2,4-dienoyl-CoA reductase-like NADH-dependent reductase (Old Yellow Enzyme family)